METNVPDSESEASIGSIGSIGTIINHKEVWVNVNSNSQLNCDNENSLPSILDGDVELEKLGKISKSNFIKSWLKTNYYTEDNNINNPEIFDFGSDSEPKLFNSELELNDSNKLNSIDETINSSQSKTSSLVSQFNDTLQDVVTNLGDYGENCNLINDLSSTGVLTSSLFMFFKFSDKRYKPFSKVLNKNLKFKYTLILLLFLILSFIIYYLFFILNYNWENIYTFIIINIITCTITIFNYLIENISTFLNKLKYIEEMFTENVYKESNNSSIFDNVNNIEKDLPKLNNIEHTDNLETNKTNTPFYKSPIFWIGSVTLVTLVTIFYLNPDILVGIQPNSNIINHNTNVTNLTLNQNHQLNLNILGELDNMRRQLDLNNIAFNNILDHISIIEQQHSNYNNLLLLKINEMNQEMEWLQQQTNLILRLDI
jgi:hypothetical protein